MRKQVWLVMLGILTLQPGCAGRGPLGHSNEDLSILPRGAQESSNEYDRRLSAQREVSLVIPPRGEHESSNEFDRRLRAQQQSRAVILPRGPHESSNEFNRRLRAQQEFSPR